MNPGLSLLLSAILWDSIILLLTVAGLWRQHAPRSSRLWTMLSRQGVGYLVVTLCVNIPMLVSMILDEVAYLMDVHPPALKVFTFLDLNGTVQSMDMIYYRLLD